MDSGKRRIILRNFQAPGDVIVLTAAVRDLHRCFPNEFETDVRTSVPALWLNNPNLTPLTEENPAVEIIDCHYPLINTSNTNGRHFLTAFHHFLGSYLKRDFLLQEFRGDLHLSDQELIAWPHLLSDFETELPCWILAAGGKFDFTAKWWPTEFYQAVVDQLRDEIQFIQVGSAHDYHPRLRGVIDLKGSTKIRDLISLVYWSAGVLCPVTFLMHLAAAVPSNDRIRHGIRPCVVVAGGREPASWESYPGHQFLHTIGLLDCCANGACWKSRTFKLYDGSKEDTNLCSRPASGYPQCMRLISPDWVVQAIRKYSQRAHFPRVQEDLELRPPQRSSPA